MKTLLTPTFFRFLAGFSLIILVSFGTLAFLSTRSTAAEDLAPISEIKDNPALSGAWLDKANAYASRGDYAAAEAIWQEMIAIVPGNPVPYGNIGRVNYLSLHDYPKAEKYFKEELARAPKERIGYLDLYDLYINAYKQDTSAAADVMHEALVAFPRDVDFTVLLAEAYARQHDLVRARATYQDALDLVRATGDVARLKAIGEALARLPQ